MTNLLSTLFLFLFISGLIYILICYTYKVSELLARISFGKLTVIYWIIILILGSIVFVLKFAQSTHTRIGCFPIINERAEINIAIADRINFYLEKSNFTEKNKIIYDIHNTFEIINIDSAKNISFIKRFGESINLDHLILVDTQDFSDNNSVINFSVTSYEANRSRAYADTLYFNNPQKFFNTFKIYLKNISTLNYSFTDNELFHSKKQWADFGKGLLYLLKENFLKAEHMFNSLHIKLPDNHSIKKYFISSLLQKALLLKTENKFNKHLYDQIFSLLHDQENVEKDSELLKLQGLMYIHNENWNFASQVLKQALVLNENDAEIYFYLSKLHSSRLKDIGYSAKIEILKKSVYLNPAYLTPSLKLGQIYLQRREFTKAKKIYKNILSINSSSIDALHGLGKMYLIQNKPVDFINTYKYILELDPENSIAYYNLGIAYLNTRDIERAEKFFQNSIDIDNFTNSYFYLGVIYALKDNPQKAISYFSKRIELEKDDEYAEESRKAIKKLRNNEDIIHLRSFHGFGKYKE